MQKPSSPPAAVPPPVSMRHSKAIGVQRYSTSCTLEPQSCIALWAFDTRQCSPQIQCMPRCYTCTLFLLYCCCLHFQLHVHPPLCPSVCLLLQCFCGECNMLVIPHVKWMDTVGSAPPFSFLISCQPPFPFLWCFSCFLSCFPPCILVQPALPLLLCFWCVQCAVIPHAGWVARLRLCFSVSGVCNALLSQPCGATSGPNRDHHGSPIE